MTPDLDRRRRAAGADPDDRAARLAHALELSRAGRGDDLIAPVASLGSWSALDPHHQDLVIAEVAGRLDDRWECLGAREWSCPVNGRPHTQRLGLFRHTELNAEFSLTPGGAYPDGHVKLTEGGVHTHTIPRYGPTAPPLLVGRWPVTTCQASGCIDGAQPPQHACGMPLTGYTRPEAELLLATFDLRLPSMAEWRWVASGGVDTRYPWGAEVDLDFVWCHENSGVPCEPGHRRDHCIHCGGQCWTPRPHPPAEHDRRGKTSAFGLVDTVGSAMEWLSDDPSWSVEGAPSGLVIGGGAGVSRHLIFPCLEALPLSGADALDAVGFRPFADIPGWRAP